MSTSHDSTIIIDNKSLNKFQEDNNYLQYKSKKFILIYHPILQILFYFVTTKLSPCKNMYIFMKKKSISHKILLLHRW